MKSVLKLLFFILLSGLAIAQEEQQYVDSLHSALKNAANDTVSLEINRTLGFYHQDSNADSGLVYHKAQLALAKKLELKLWEADAYQQIAYCYSKKFQLSTAYENYMQALKIVENPSSAKNGYRYSNFSFSKSPDGARQSIMGMIHYELGTFYSNTRNNKEAFNELLMAVEIGESLKNQKILSLATRDIGTYYLNINMADSAFIYFQKALRYYQNSPYQKNLGVIYLLLGNYYVTKQKYDSAKISFYKAIRENTNSTLGNLGPTVIALGNVYIETGQLDSALKYTIQAQELADALNDPPGKATSFIQLGTIYQLKKEYSVAYDYLKKGIDIGFDLSDYTTNKLMQFQNLDFDQKLRLQELEKERQQEKSRNRMYAMLTWLGIFLFGSILLYRNNRQKQKANKILEATLTNLKSAQSQLVQSEKMASLGELTAGIAHEIQNPLNFVNNFSEVNKEMLSEMRDEIEKKNYDEVSSIAKDVEENEEKIIFHGKRADAIVKGMLQHSRSSSGQKEPTDINALCDEYLRLSYHGLRAKDKSFTATMKTDYDKNIGLLKIIPQDIGRVVLNLITNAFYVVSEKKKLNVSGYEPVVSVSTKKTDDQIEIKVTDNGNGIPESVKEKIFQPFFTTKPTGQGTGLGLSLAFDIVTKGHGGELRVETKEGEGTAFVVSLPV